MSGPGPLTLEDAGRALRSGAVTSTALTARCLERIAASQDRLGAFVTVCAETAMQAAAKADAALTAGADCGPLLGIPLAVKDIVATRDAPTTANSRVLDPSWGKGVDAPVVARLRAAGAVIVGKATTSEFALGMPEPEAGFPMPRNPWHPDHTASGSSSGTAIAVVSGLALGGIGTDTGGSVRAPAAANGHSGLKVTYGRVPKNGVVPLAYSLDTVGPMAHSALGCALILEAIAGHDPGDPSSATAEVPAYAAQLTGSLEGLRIGLPMPYFFDSPELDAEARAATLEAARILAAAGATVEETVVPFAKEARVANALTMTAEGFSYHRNDLVRRWADYGGDTRMTLVRGALLTAADYAQAQRFRSRFRREVATVLSSFDALLTPGSLGPAERADEMRMEHRLVAPSFHGQWNFAGLPAIVVPCGVHSTGLPLALQVVGPPFAEATVLRVADAYQRRTDWHRRVPPGAPA